MRFAKGRPWRQFKVEALHKLAGEWNGYVEPMRQEDQLPKIFYGGFHYAVVNDFEEHLHLVRTDVRHFNHLHFFPFCAFQQLQNQKKKIKNDRFEKIKIFLF